MKNIVYKIPLLLCLCFGITMFAQQQNYLSVSGNKLFDTTGKEVRLTGVNWFGFETQTYFPHGIWTRDMKSVLQQIKDLGFNTIRLPWCNEMLNPGVTINVNSFGTDAYTGVSPMNVEESQVETPIELMDILVQWCQDNDIKIVLDNHSRAADGFLNEAFWYTDQYSEQRWINDWLFMAERYKTFSAVIGMDLNNEPHGSTWGNSNPATDWNKAAERCGNAILEVNPNVLIIVEGVGEFQGDSYWWGGQLMGAAQYPIQLSNQNKLMYSAHEYGPEVAPQDWFTAQNFPQNMPQLWQDHFHYLYENGTSPLFIGEFGIKDQNAFNGIAFTWFTEWMDFMGDIYSWTFWTMNPNSGDTGGILQDDWATVNEWKMDVLRPHFAPIIPNVVGGSTGNRPPVARFIANQVSGNAPLTVQFDASGSSDPDNDTLTYSWNFGDGTTSNGVEVSHVFTQPGNYTVTLTVNDGTLNSADTTTINVADSNNSVIITANITANTTTGEAPILVSFDASGSSSSDNSTLSYTWDFGDGSTGNGVVVSHEYTTAGNYGVTLTVSNTSGSSDTATVSIMVTSSNNGGTCNFETPLSSPLPTISNTTYSKAYVLGSGGPDLSNVTNFTINWDLQNNGLWQLSMNTNNGVPSWWNNFLPMVTQNFNQPEPEITITGSDFPQLDGSYWVALDGDNFVLVSKNEDFSIYFSNADQAPDCASGVNVTKNQITKEENNFTVKVNPNPATNYIDVTMPSVALHTTTIRLININGQIIRTYNFRDVDLIKIPLENVSRGLYILEVTNNERRSLQKLVIK